MKTKIISVILILSLAIALNSQVFATQVDFRETIVNAPDAPTYKLSNFLSMRQELEKLTKTDVTGLGGFGMLYVTYKQAVQEKKPKEKIYYDMSVLHSKVDTTINDNKAKLSQFAANAFGDIEGKEWYAYLVPSAVYYGMISGYADNTFKGNNNISYAEFGSILGNYNGKKSGLEKGELSGEWYSQTIGKISLDYANSSNLDKNTIHHNISRGEAAMIIANSFFGEELEETRLYSIVDSEKGRRYFKDSGSVIRIKTEEYARMKYEEIRKWYLNSKKGNAIPEPVLESLIVLKDKGIMVGDTNGNSNWNQDITRAEVLSLMYKLGCLD